MCTYTASVCLLAGLAVATLAGCSSNPTAADTMRGHAADVQSRADQENKSAADWDKGKKLIASGDKNVEAGERRAAAAEKDLQRGRDQVALGRREQAEGRALVEAAERSFRLAYPDQTLGSGN
ncbi:MAG: hypothetical protein JJT88_05415 [Gammaproteobacteria bacterium]|nr:hypothetical protein [Gammaproteobacteria bacterium]